MYNIYIYIYISSIRHATFDLHRAASPNHIIRHSVRVLRRSFFDDKTVQTVKRARPARAAPRSALGASSPSA